MLSAQALPETVGRIEGADISVKGTMSVEVENGQSTTVLSSGSDVTVKSGQARLTLVEGGEIGVCGPAHFTVLKSGGAITLALDYGRMHTLLHHTAPVTIYTPMVLASPIAIGEGPRDATIGLQSTGEMCVQAARGAVRLEQQLTGQSLLVPQGGEVALAGGQMESLRGTREACQCEVLIARTAPTPGPKPPELSVPVPASLAPPNKPSEETNPRLRDELKSTTVEEPVYKVLMPPLSFDAKPPAPPPDPSSETMLLVREVRVRPAVVFHGRVEAPETATAPSTQASLPPAGAPNAALEAPQKRKEAGLGARIKNFFRRLFSRGPCAGAGCASEQRQGGEGDRASRGKSDYMPS